MDLHRVKARSTTIVIEALCALAKTVRASSKCKSSWTHTLMLSAPLSFHKTSQTCLELQARMKFVFGLPTIRKKCWELSWCRVVNMILPKQIASSSVLMERALLQVGLMVRSGHFYLRVVNSSGSSTMHIKREARISVASWQSQCLMIAIIVFQVVMTSKLEFGTSVNKPKSFSLLKKSIRDQSLKYYILKENMTLS